MNEMTAMKAGAGRCQEASPMSGDHYIPCNAPATCVIEADGQEVLMCEPCAHHSTKNRGLTRLRDIPAADRVVTRGDNNPPPFDPAVLEAHARTTLTFLDAAGEYLDLKVIETEEQAGRLNDFITGARGLYKKIEDARKAAKKPHDDAGKAVTAAFSPLLDRLERTVEKLKPMIGDYLRRKEAAERAERDRQRAEAAEKARQAEALAAQAAARNDISGEIEAERLAKEAEEQTKAANREVKVNAGSATGAGRAVSMREHRRGEILNWNAAYYHFRDDPDLKATLQRLTDAMFRAAGGGDIEVTWAKCIKEMKPA